MAFTVTTTTLGGNTARLITGSGNLDDLATALAAHGVTQAKRTLTFAGTGAATYYRMDGTLTEQRDGIWTVIVSTNSFVCWAGAGATTTLGLVDANGARTSRVNIVYASGSLAVGADPYNAAEYMCFSGAGTLRFYAGSLSYEVNARSDLDIRSNGTVTFDAVEIQQASNSSYAHAMTGTGITTSANTRFRVSPEYLEFVAAITTINPVSVDTGVRMLYKGSTSVTTVLRPKYNSLNFFGATTGAIANCYDPATNYLTSDGGSDNGVLNILRTVAVTFKDQLGVNITSPVPNLVALKPDASTATSAFSAGAASYAALQSYTAVGVAYALAGTGFTDLGTYSFYAVGFGYAANYSSVNVKTAHSGNSGITWAANATKSPLVTTAYGSVVTSGFALTTGTDTLAITTSRTTDQSAEYLFKHAYDNPATTYWFGKLHTPATQNAGGYIDFGATNITVTGVTLSGSAFSTTGTITLASGAICSANVVKSSGVFSAGDIDNVTGSVTLTGTARWDITTGGVAPAGSAAAGNTIRVTSAAALADFDFQAFTFNASTTFENTSGNNITLTLAGGQTAPTKLETSGTITIVAPTVSQGLAFTGLLAGSQAKVFETGTQTELFSDTNSATSETWSQLGGFDTVVDYTIFKDGYIPIRVTGLTVNSAVVGVPVQQSVDPVYITPSGLTWGTTATVNVAGKTFAISAATTGQNWYSFMVQQWRQQATLQNVAFPLTTNGPNSVRLANGWEFSGGLSNWTRDGLAYFNTSGVRTAAWAAVLTSGTTAGHQVRYLQSDGGTFADAANTGPMDQLVQVYGDASHGNFDRTGFLVVKIQKEGFDQAEADIYGTYGTLEDQLYVVGLQAIPNGVAASSTARTITITDSPVTWQSKTWSLTIDATGVSGTQLMQWLRYSFVQAGTFQSKPTFNWHDLVQTNGAKFKTVRGVIHGDASAALKGVRVLASGAAHPDFDTFTADDGTTYSPPVTQSFTVDGLVSGSYVQIYDVTNAVQLAIGTSTTSFVWVDSGAATGDRQIRIRVAYCSGASAKEFIEVANAGTCGTTVATANKTYTVAQVDDAVYNANAIAGSGVTGITISDAIDRMQINIAGGTVSWRSIYAYNVYWLSTAAGIVDDGSIITAKDQANYSVTLFKIKNTGATPLKITQGWGVDATTGSVEDIIDLTGGNIYPVVDHVVSSVVSVGGANIITGDIADIPAAVWAHTIP